MIDVLSWYYEELRSQEDVDGYWPTRYIFL
jgi:hypothetical protein